MSWKYSFNMREELKIYLLASYNKLDPQISKGLNFAEPSLCMAQANYAQS